MRALTYTFTGALLALASLATTLSVPAYLAQLAGSPVLWSDRAGGVAVIDDGDTGYGPQGGTVFQSGGYGDDFVSRNQRVSWSFRSVPAGRYEVYVTWQPVSGLPDGVSQSPRVRYEVKSDAWWNQPERVTIDQTRPPAGPAARGVRWERLAVIDVHSDRKVEVQAEIDRIARQQERFAADAVWLRPAESTIIKPVVAAVEAVCGDGIVSGVEECDDGNQIIGDGCTVCLLEDRLIPAPVVTRCRADFDGQNGVTIDDLNILVANFNQPGTRAQGDANGDGQVDTADADIFRFDFDHALCPPSLAQPVAFSSASSVSQTSSSSSASGETLPVAAVTRGNLYVRSRTPDLVLPRQLLSGETGEPVLQLELRADDEDIRLEAITLTATGGGVGAIERLDLFTEGTGVPFAQAGICQSGFCALAGSGGLLIPAGGGEVIVLARPVIRAGALAAPSFLYFSLPADGVQARGATSGMILDHNDADAIEEGEVLLHPSAPAADHPNQPIVSTPNAVVTSKITAITNAGPEAGVLVAGSREIGRFRFQAASHGNQAVISGVVLLVFGTNTEIDTGSLRLFNAASPSQSVVCRAFTTATGEPLTGRRRGAFQALCSGLASVIDSSLSPGETAMFILRAHVTSAQVVSSARSELRVLFQTYNGFNDSFGPGPSQSRILWLDGGVPYSWTEYFGEGQVTSTVYSR